MRALALTSFLAAAILAVPATAEEGMIFKTASTDVAETVEAFTSILAKKGATVFAVIEHHNGAASVDLEMKPNTVVVFGNPKMGTPLMQASPTIGLDLPLRVVFYEDEDGKTQIVYHDLDAIAKEHGVPNDHPALMKAKGAIRNLTDAVAK